MYDFGLDNSFLGHQKHKLSKKNQISPKFFFSALKDTTEKVKKTI